MAAGSRASPPVTGAAAEAALDGFVDRFAPDMQVRIRGCRAAMRARFPDAVEMIYDNYNFLVLGFGPTDRPSEALFSLAAFRGGVLLCFVQRGPEIDDPGGLLRGSGSIARNILLDGPESLALPEVSALIESACRLARIPMSASEGPTVIMKSVSAKQRPRQ